MNEKTVAADLTNGEVLQPLETAVRMHSVAEQHHLDGAGRLANYHYTRRVCNGIGAAWMPGWTRKLTGTLAAVLEPTSWVHDLDYEAGGGVIERWIADWRFLRNALRAARYTYAWDQLRRYTTALTAFRFWLLLRVFGAAAFKWHMKVEGI